MYNFCIKKAVRFLSVLIILFISANVSAKRVHHEAIYQEHFCEGLNGESEHILPDRTRVDCLTDKYAVEVDFAEKWGEAVGQSLYYAHCTGKKPGILLILESDKDEKHLHKIEPLVKLYNIELWLIRPERLSSIE